MIDVAQEIEKDTKLKLNVLRLMDEGKSDDYIKSYVIGWLKQPSKEARKNGK